MTNISAMKALAELNKLEAQRNSTVNQPQEEKKFSGFSMFGFGFKTQAKPNPDEIPPEGFNLKT